MIVCGCVCVCVSVCECVFFPLIYIDEGKYNHRASDKERLVRKVTNDALEEKEVEEKMIRCKSGFGGNSNGTNEQQVGMRPHFKTFEDARKERPSIIARHNTAPAHE
ncbi:unnamed protein product [Thelazia callipaeda]|uniref:HABP4_PAI-RBP1 domain-containing protein n=1 Tax=Thelazia callipaeda TaxID=103827 RepID=A0A0N5D316_THECL|nr:unnamed protein product [Thelazia callipaeda]